MTVNGTLSIPNALRAERPEDYYKNTATIEWPDGADGQPLAIEIGFYSAVAFKAGGHVPLAKEFVRFLVADGWLAHYLDFSGDRYLPPMPKLLDAPFWLDPSDPHRMAAAMQFLTRPRAQDLAVASGDWRHELVGSGERLGQGRPPRRRRGHQPRAGGRRRDRAHQGDPGGVTAPRRIVPYPFAIWGRSPAFPRFLASKAPCNGRYGMGMERSSGVGRVRQWRRDQRISARLGPRAAPHRRRQRLRD